MGIFFRHGCLLAVLSNYYCKSRFLPGEGFIVFAGLLSTVRLRAECHSLKI
jgi:hypothetical protein